MAQLVCLFGLNRLLTCAEAPFLDELLEAEALEETVQLVRIVVIPQVLRRIKVHRHLFENGRKPVGHAGALLPGGELFAHAVLDLER